MSISEFTHGTKAEGPVRRFEVFTGAGRRRDWSDEEKDRIVAESYGGELSVSALARRHGLSPGQLFTWRRQSRKQLEPSLSPMFVPAAIEAVSDEPRNRRKRAVKVTPSPAAIELEIDGAILRIASGTDATTIAAVIQALKAQS